MKKYMVYKLMGSNLFIDYSLSMMKLCYKILGVRLTNFAINKSVASLFTAGETLTSLNKDIESLKEQNINGVANYVVEGLSEMNEVKID